MIEDHISTLPVPAILSWVSWSLFKSPAPEIRWLHENLTVINQEQFPSLSVAKKSLKMLAKYTFKAQKWKHSTFINLSNFWGPAHIIKCLGLATLR